MDVILDSNVVLGDLKFRGTQFGELFAYLKRTGCSLVLPTMVTEEVLERYRERLKNSLNQAKSSWVGLSSMTMTDRMPFPSIDLEREFEMLDLRMQMPAPGVNVVRYTDVSGVDANEIARRGAKRLRPANTNGEELRDVILWLLLFQYAKNTGHEVALISGDHGFRKAKDADDLHPDLQTEIASANLPIHFYREVSSFVTSQSLSQTQIDEHWITQYISTEEMDKSVLSVLSQSYFGSFGAPKQARISELKFVSGKSYQISKDSVYGEARYKVLATFTFQYLPDQFSVWNSFPSSAQLGKAAVSFLNSPGVSGAVQIPNAFQDDQLINPAGTVFAYNPNVAAQVVSLQDISPGILYSPSVSANIVYASPQSVQKDYRFDVSLSLRIESGKMLNWQLDEILQVQVE